MNPHDSVCGFHLIITILIEVENVSFYIKDVFVNNFKQFNKLNDRESTQITFTPLSVAFAAAPRDFAVKHGPLLHLDVRGDSWQKERHLCGKKHRIRIVPWLPFSDIVLLWWVWSLLTDISLRPPSAGFVLLWRYANRVLLAGCWPWSPHPVLGKLCQSAELAFGPLLWHVSITRGCFLTDCRAVSRLSTPRLFSQSEIRGAK